jgi:ApbE superfamily uncharacterized protein (UPF0280 family)
MPTAKHQERVYRNLMQTGDLTAFRVIVKETDLSIRAAEDLSRLAREHVLEQRGYIEAFIERYPDFAKTFEPWPGAEPAPPIVRDMIDASRKAGVGPMAAVAGAVAEHVGRALLARSGEVIVENGGDIFLQTAEPKVTGIWAGTSPLSLKFGIRLGGGYRPTGVCTSSGTLGHSTSRGRADAVCAVSANCALADAVATAAANRVRSAADIDGAIAFGRNVPGIEGLVVIVAKRVGMWGRIALEPLK